MSMFVHDSELAELEMPQASADLHAQIRLAWGLRQRDTRRAWALATQLLAQLRPQQSAQQARLLLVQGEAKWLFAELDAARDFARQALQIFSDIQDGSGVCDCHWLLAAVLLDQGRHAQGIHNLEQGASAAQQGGDSARAAICMAAQARWAMLADSLQAQARFDVQLDFARAEQDQGLAAWIEDYRALRASRQNDFGRAALHFIQSHQAALATGQLRAAIIAATNLAEDLNRLGDHQSALEQMQRALELARPTGWPRSVGACLLHTAETMRRLQRLDAAQELLDEARPLMQALAQARSYAHALQYQGDLALDMGDHARALDSFRQLEQRAIALQQRDFKCIALRGQAQALAGMQQRPEAASVAMLALQEMRQTDDLFGQIAGLQVLAQIHARGDLPLPPDITQDPRALDEVAREASLPLYFLKSALRLGRSIPGYTLPLSLLDQLAQEYARCGQFEAAYQVSQEANATRERAFYDQAQNRAIALQISHRTERALAEGEHHRQLAQAEARRASLLQQTSATLEHLSAIGQEITGHLDAQAVYEVLYRHVQDMLDTNSFAIYRFEAESGLLLRSFGIEQGEVLPFGSIPLDDQYANCALCARERCEVLADDPDPASHLHGSLVSRSALFVPLLVSEELLGVITVQSVRRHAYGERERLIFRSLCAYGAIALDNAQTYLRLLEAQSQLVAQEKMAALGSLVAGVAHELNTPIGNSLTIASTLDDKSAEFARKVEANSLRRSELNAFVDDARDASAMMVRVLSSAAELLHSFKQVAMDRTSAQKRSFDLLQTSQEIVATMMNQIRRAGHQIMIKIPPGIRMHSYPGPYGQVITNFINNALLHGFDGVEQGQMELSAEMQGEDMVRICFSDNGRGISELHLKRIFEPFFTTKLGQGGSGLGLSISYNIVTSILHGQVSAISSPDAGACFVLLLPCEAPDAPE
ncbi:ATP-binding protein [Massilia sp. W12]|uniref:ATP-binding protein n=1 Tax=Massilia sp. W12 TaxID=3126507 RepID=UPI0030D5B3DE